MVGNNLDSVRQEAAMGHGVTQWFGAENMNSATSFNKRMDMKKFAASTDVGGNRTRTGDDSMANVVGGTSILTFSHLTRCPPQVEVDMV